LLKMRNAAQKAKKFPKNESLAFCYDMLNRVSRSFAIVIQELPLELRDSVCVFYLVLRALDTVEDDMAIAQDVKCPILESFHEKCYDRSFKMDCGAGEYTRLMKEYPLVVDAFLGLKPEYQKVIADITKRMGAGMSEFIPKQVVKTAEYDKYCYYVAGLVGVGLSKLFAVSGLESAEFLQTEELSDSMGKFLQKTNIIRDYLEDITEEPAPRMFWPQEIWGKYAEKLEDFKDVENADAALACLNHLISDALHHMPDCFDYMGRLKDPAVFLFCAIPQVMAMATLCECYNNHNVFTGVVKIRRGLSARMMLEVRDMGSFCQWTLRFANELARKVRPMKDPNAKTTLEAIERIEDLCSATMLKLGVTRTPQNRQPGDVIVDETPIPIGVRIALFAVFFGYFVYAWKVVAVRMTFGVEETYQGQRSLDYFNKSVSVFCMAFVSYLCYTGKRW